MKPAWCSPSFTISFMCGMYGPKLCGVWCLAGRLPFVAPSSPWEKGRIDEPIDTSKVAGSPVAYRASASFIWIFIENGIFTWSVTEPSAGNASRRFPPSLPTDWRKPPPLSVAASLRACCRELRGWLELRELSGRLAVLSVSVVELLWAASRSAPNEMLWPAIDSYSCVWCYPRLGDGRTA